MSTTLDFDLPASVKYDIACMDMDALDIQSPDSSVDSSSSPSNIALSNHYEIIISQLRTEIQQWRYQNDMQQNQISALQQQLSSQQSSFDVKFSEFLNCANHYDKTKSVELESLKRVNECLSKKNNDLRIKMQHLMMEMQGDRGSPSSSVCLLTSDGNSSSHSHSHSDRPNGPMMDYKQYTLAQLKALRIRQQNIVYVVGLPVSLCNAKLLKSNRWFGKFGPISRICFNTSPKCVKANSIPTFVTYNSQRDALNAIQKMNLYCLSDGTRLKTNYGRTKYCPAFCEGQQCLNHKCKFLHEWALQDDIITQQEINDFNAIRAGPPSRFNKLH